MKRDKNKNRKLRNNNRFSTSKITGVVTPNTIVNLLDKKPQQRYSVNQIAKYFKVSGSLPKKELKIVLESLAAQGSILQFSTKYYQSAKNIVHITGTVDHVNPNFGYIISESLENDVWVSTRNLKGAIHGDEVEFVVYESEKKGRDEAEVKRVLYRKNTQMVGRIELSTRYAFFVPNNRKIYTDIFVSKADTMEAAHADRVIVEVTDWAVNNGNPEGKVIKVLGASGNNDAEIHAIMFEYGLPFEFPEDVEAAADRIPEVIPKEEIAKRRDLRSVTTFTIDPENAKDFDDALSIQKLENGNWEIGIHIADVTHYVRPKTKIEEEAYQRATSVYLVDRVVPMLPEKLSNKLCSLRPHEDKLCFSAIFELNEEAHIVQKWFGRTTIHSDHRFTYEQAQEVIESKEGNYAEELELLNTLAYKLKNDRYNNGAISFESVEFYFQLDEDGTPLGMQPKERKDAHKLIEEFMLMANREVATFVYKNRKKESDEPKTMVYRTHDLPDQERLESFAFFAKRLGYNVSTNRESLAKSLNKLNVEVEGKPEQNILESQAIRVMAKAKYTTEPIGHYGLGFAHYTHFTSPIRRYPDMMAHRLLQHYLEGNGSVERAPYEEKSKHSSEMEKRAADAERASIKYKQVEFMQKFLNEEMEGFVSGTTEWGMFVELKETKCEGMIRLASIPGDYYYFDEENMQIVGRKTGVTYMLGDDVKVKVFATNLDKRTIDLALVL